MKLIKLHNSWKRISFKESLNQKIQSQPLVKETQFFITQFNFLEVKIDERVEMWDYKKNGRPTCGCC